MHIIDIVVVCAAVLVVLVFIGVLARQRYMLRVSGAIPLAVHGRGARWQYGIGRYDGSELRWYRALGLGTRPTRVLRRADLVVESRREPQPAELSSLPPSAVIIECRDHHGPITLALGEGAFTGFLSWLESSRPSR